MRRNPLSTIFVRPSVLDRRRGRLVAGSLSIRCALGRGGVVRAKREGDGGTPAGALRPVELMFRPENGHPDAPFLPSRPIRPNQGWCDDPRHPRYNRRVALPFPGSHERLWRDDALYDCVIELDWNRRPAIKGRGSAIFLHIARPGFTPTEGCIAVSASAMRRLLPLLSTETRFVIA